MDLNNKLSKTLIVKNQFCDEDCVNACSGCLDKTMCGNIGDGTNDLVNTKGEVIDAHCGAPVSGWSKYIFFQVFQVFSGVSFSTFSFQSKTIDKILI